MRSSAFTRIVIWSLVSLFLFGTLISGLFLNKKISFPFFVGHNGGFSYKTELGSNFTLGGGEVDSQGIRRINVDWLDGTVDIAFTDTDKITFSESYSGNLSEKDQMRYYLNGGSLTLVYCGDRHFPSFPPKNWRGKNLKVQIPRSMKDQLQELNLESLNANLNIQDATAQSVNIENLNGNITLNQLTANSLDLQTVSGGITVTNINVQELDLENVSGDVSVSGTAQEISSETVSGDLKLDLLSCPLSMNVDSVSGDVAMWIPENDGFSARLDRISGDFISDFPVTKTNRAFLYKNGGAEFQLSTVSGDMIVNRK